MRTLREHNFKIYFIIIFASLFVVLLGVKNYEDAKAQITALADKNKIVASENMVGNFSFWLDERLHSLVRAAKFMQNAGISQDGKKLGGFIRLFKENSAEFDALQFLREDGEIFVDGKKLEGDETMPKSLRTGLVWFEETKNTLAPTVNFMQRHKNFRRTDVKFMRARHGWWLVCGGILRRGETAKYSKKYGKI